MFYFQGQVFINDMNIGRYWPDKGPQVSLYVPRYALHPITHVMLVELEWAPQTSPTVSFTDTPMLGEKSQHLIGQHKKRTII